MIQRAKETKQIALEAEMAYLKALEDKKVAERTVRRLEMVAEKAKAKAEIAAAKAAGIWKDEYGDDI